MMKTLYEKLYNLILQKFVSDLRQVGRFLLELRFPSPIMANDIYILHESQNMIQPGERYIF